MTNDKNNMIASCLIGAVVFLALYLLFTSWCSRKDNFISPTTQTLTTAIGANYPSEDEEIMYSPEDVETPIQEPAERDALDFFHSFPSEPARVGKTLAYQAAMINKYNKDLRYC